MRHIATKFWLNLFTSCLTSSQQIKCNNSGERRMLNRSVPNPSHFPTFIRYCKEAPQSSDTYKFGFVVSKPKVELRPSRNQNRQNFRRASLFLHAKDIQEILGEPLFMALFQERYPTVSQQTKETLKILAKARFNLNLLRPLIHHLYDVSASVDFVVLLRKNPCITRFCRI